MIHEQCLSIEWINRVASEYHTDRILLEKCIRAITLLERLAVSDMIFVFKGGTALSLMFQNPKRLSIDIDILTPEPKNKLNGIFKNVNI